MLAFAPRLDEAGSAQVLKVLGGVGEGLARARGQRLHRALALAEDLEQLQPVLVAERPRQRGELAEEAVLRGGAAA